MSVLEIKNLSKSFNGNKVLNGISLNVEAGEVISIIGPSGGGKTTLLRCINFLEIADEGVFAINGKTIFDAAGGSPDEKELIKLRKHLGLVFQQFNLFPQYTALENVTLAPILNGIEADKARELGLELLDQVGLKSKADSYPCELSGGQQQRVAIARALALRPDVLCFDEPTSSLDPEITGEVLRVIRELADQNITMLIVTHEIGFAREISDRAIFIDDGQIMAEGAAPEIFDNPPNERLKNFLGSILTI